MNGWPALDSQVPRRPGRSTFEITHASETLKPSRCQHAAGRGRPGIILLPSNFACKSSRDRRAGILPADLELSWRSDETAAAISQAGSVLAALGNCPRAWTESAALFGGADSVARAIPSKRKLAFTRRVSSVSQPATISRLQANSKKQ